LRRSAILVAAGRPAGKWPHRLPGQERDPGGPPAARVSANGAGDRFALPAAATCPIGSATTRYIALSRLVRQGATGHDCGATQIRPVSLEDAEPLVDLLRANREFLAPWEPIRDPEFHTLAGQRTEIEKLLATRSVA
jgi:hypothetical protein